MVFVRNPRQGSGGDKEFNYVLLEVESVNMEHLPISQSRLKEIQQCTEADTGLQVLK